MVDHYLAVRIGKQVIVKDLVAYDGHFNLGGSIATCDVDGDGYDEILVQQTVAMSGGMGAYLSRVFDYKDGELIEIFSSDDFFDKVGSDTGFSITLMEDQKFKIDNAITGYSEVFRLEDRSQEYFDAYWGESSREQIYIDSFYEFAPKDIDDDGVYEIACRQYAWLVGHTDGIGCAKTVLKYNTDTSTFEIISASFDLEF